MRKDSMIVKLAEEIIKKEFDRKSELEVREELTEKLSNQEVIYEKPNSILMKSDTIKIMLKDYVCYRVNSDANSSKVIMYLHGGGFIGQINFFHWRIIDQLAQKCHCEVLVPIYPVLPYGTYLQGIEVCQLAYEYLMEQGKKIIMMGDSAGGGLALSFCEYLSQLGYPQPTQGIYFSPWLDLGMSNQRIPELQDNDLFLYAPSLKEWGRWWSKGSEVTNYLVSPLYGNNKDLDHITFFVGTAEIFYFDILEFAHLLQNQGKSIELIEGKDMGHEYPIFPIKEGNDAIKQCIKMINEII